MGAVTALAHKLYPGRSNMELLRMLVPDIESGRVESPAFPSLKKVVAVNSLACHPTVSLPLKKCRALSPYSELVSRSEKSVVSDETINI